MPPMGHGEKERMGPISDCICLATTRTCCTVQYTVLYRVHTVVQYIYSTVCRARFPLSVLIRPLNYLSLLPTSSLLPHF